MLGRVPLPYEARRRKLLRDGIYATYRIFQMITTILTIAAFTAPPLELHTHSGSEGRYLRAAIAHDIYVSSEFTSACRYFQSELRPLITHRNSLDCFVMVGRTRTKFPDLCREHPAFVVLFVKREIDIYHQPRRYEYTTDSDDRFVGMLDIGGEAVEATPTPLPWEQDYQLTAWNPPGVER